jgi:PHD/YefM family antitoxin component YafN of YafNO toxin-antitoxin module
MGRMKTLSPKPELVLKNGKPTAVILKIKDYEALLERAEDAEDLRWLRERRKQPAHFRSFEEFLAEENRGV